MCVKMHLLPLFKKLYLFSFYSSLKYSLFNSSLFLVETFLVRCNYFLINFAELATPIIIFLNNPEIISFNLVRNLP